ncbi:glycosyltransferase [Enterococcus sp. LJL128]
MRLFILMTDYPDNNGYVSQYFVHTRNIEYLKSGIEVIVLNFSANSSYEIDGVKVINLDLYEQNKDDFRCKTLISHQPNLRNHYRFLKKNGDRFDKFIFFFHGHEVLRTSEIYPKPYDYIKNRNKLKGLLNNSYDTFKLKMWKNFFERNNEKSTYIFVSHWMKKMFLKFVGMDEKLIDGRNYVIYNSIGSLFEEETYDQESKKKYDFITIRNMLDKSKYCIDVVTRLAQNNPEYNFAVFGKGDFYKFIEKPKNLFLIEKHLSHKEIIEQLNKSRYALMPTRADAQGVMMCEMATFGIPTITSDIDVCQEVFSNFTNVTLIDNDEFNKIDEKKLKSKYEEKNKMFYRENTIGHEIKLFKELVEEDNA